VIWKTGDRCRTYEGSDTWIRHIEKEKNLATFGNGDRVNLDELLPPREGPIGFEAGDLVTVRRYGPLTDGRVVCILSRVTEGESPFLYVAISPASGGDDPNDPQGIAYKILLTPDNIKKVPEWRS